MPIKIKKVQSSWSTAHRILFLLVISYQLLVTDGYAASCYGTRMPEKKEFHIGLQTYTIFKRYLEHEAGKLRSSQEFLLLSFGVYDWLSIDLKGGPGFIKQHPLRSDELDYPTYMGGGYGFRLKLYEGEFSKMVFGFQHISVHPKTIKIGNIKHKAVSDDWQFSLLVSLGSKKFTPYLGTRWSRFDYIHWVNGHRERIRSDLTKSFGLILGFDLPVSERVWLNLEGQLFDSEASALSINFKF